jgi:hypothetical protein
MSQPSPVSSGLFVTRPGDLFAPPPYRVETANFDGFVIGSSYDPLNAFLEQQLGAVTGGECQFLAVVPAVIVTYISIARSFSLAAAPSQAGYYLEQDLMLWLLVAQFRQGDIVPERIGFWVPFVWVGHPAALIEGREGFGYPKGFGNISIPDGGDAQCWSCDAYAFPGDPSQQLTLSTVNSVEPANLGDDEFVERWGSAEEARRAILAALVDDPAAHRYAPNVAPVDLTREFALYPHVNFLLRQFRSAGDPSDAVYQEIIAAPYDPVTFHGGGVRGGQWTAEFPALPALDLAGLLGVECPSAVRLAYQVTLDTTLAPATTVWSSGVA